MLCTLVFAATGAIASNASEITIDGDTIFAKNAAYRDGGETQQTPRLDSPVSTTVVNGRPNHSRAVSVQVADD